MIHHFPIWRLTAGRTWLGLVVLLVVVGLVLLIVYLTNRKYKTPGAVQSNVPVQAPSANAAQERFLAILNDQKTSGSMGAAEYEERRLILEGGRGDNHANEDLVALKERYARGELTTGAFIKDKNKLFESN